MQVRRGRDWVEIWAPAKINLFFEVLGRRADGFHEIETLMAPISLYDTLAVADDPSGQVTFSAVWAPGDAARDHRTDREAHPDGDEAWDLPQGEENICVRAVRLLAERAGARRGARLSLVKRIASAAGLGGGSSDAAAALVGADQVWNLGWPGERLAEVAAELGSDVPFFLAGGPAVCRGRGERIERADGLGNLNLVIVRPPAGLSTAAVYRACRPAECTAAVHPVLDALRRGDYGRLGKEMPNRLIEPARNLSPWIDRTLDRLREAGAGVVGMSGSGSSCFAIGRSRRETLRLASRLRSGRSSAGRVWVVRTLR